MTPESKVEPEPPLPGRYERVGAHGAAATGGDVPVQGVAGAEPQNGWNEIAVHTSFHVVAPRPCWVVKVKNRYVRVPTVGFGVRLVSDKRFATRFDSSLWAATIAGGVRRGRIVRLVSKAEREIEAESKKAAEGPRRFVFGATGTPKRADGQSVVQEEPSKDGSPAATETTTPKGSATTSPP